ncbi:hypothetical protein [Bifidobacterium choloepi]|uniref:Uncharacterized protein n=1 Tax=Bifidobacterium choloepi TaxID=2614131 RepID=A0A6I5N988_9BIFI|nr:hypothetical protein [Bifidobacterium choloepi]NEG70371.1 hypothetical protein [Bifidobacterium choloepi]
MSLLQGFEAVSTSNGGGKAVLTITKTSVHFNKSAVEALGGPEHVKFLINPKTKQFAVQVCGAEDPNSLPFFKESSTRKSVTLKTPVLMDAVLPYFTFEDAPEGEIAYASLHGTKVDDDTLVFDAKEPNYGVMKKRGRKKASL